jgi:MFS family permease
MFINRSFLFLWLGQGLSQFATNVLVFFISFFIYKQTSSNIAVSGALLSFLVPSFLSSILAGVIVDRMGKKWVLFISNLIRAFIVFFLFFFEGNISFMYFFIALLALTTQFFMPAESSIIPRIVSAKRLITANAYFSITIYLTLILGFLFSPILFKILQYKALFVVLILYIVAAIAVYFVDVKEPVFYTNFRQPVTDLLSKFRTNFLFILRNFFKNKSINRNVSQIIIIQVVLFVLISLAPGFADKILKIPVEDLSFLIVFPTAIGFLIASLIISRLKKINELSYIHTSFWLLGLIFLTIFWLSQYQSRALVNDLNFISLMLFGFFSGVIIILSYARLQRSNNAEGNAGYFGILNALVNLASIVPVLLSGYLSDFFGTDKIMGVISIIFFILAVRYKSDVTSK